MQPERQPPAGRKQTFSAAIQENYDQVYSLRGGKKAACYSRKKLNRLHPDGQFAVVGEAVYGQGPSIGMLKLGGARVPVFRYRRHSRWMYSERGYVACKDRPGEYIALLKTRLPVYFIGLLACAVLVMAGIWLFSLETASPAGPGIDDNVVDWTGSLPEVDTSGQAAEGNRFPGFTTMTIKAGTAKQTTNSLFNPTENTCYFQLRLVLTDEEWNPVETLYESQLIAPGKAIREFTLSRALEPGQYKARLQYVPYAMDGVTRLNGTDIKFELVAQ